MNSLIEHKELNIKYKNVSDINTNLFETYWDKEKIHN